MDECSFCVFVLEMTKEISGWSKHPSADTILALKATKMLQYIEDIQVFGVNMSFISLSEVKNFYIS